MQRDIFASISPLDHRYYASSPHLFGQLSDYLSENALIRYQAKVEEALVRVLARRKVCSDAVAAEVSLAVRQVTPDEVYAEEAITRHNIRALVNCIRRRVSEEAGPYVHFTATSVDVMDTARTLSYRDVTVNVILPLLRELLRVLIDVTRREASTLQIGRTHGSTPCQ